MGGALVITRGFGIGQTTVEFVTELDVVGSTPSVSVEVNPDEILDLSVLIDQLNVAVDLPEDDEIGVTDADLNIDVEVC